MGKNFARKIKKIITFFKENPIKLVYLLIIIYVFIFTSLSILNYLEFAYANDLCVVDRAIWVMSKGKLSNSLFEAEKNTLVPYHFHLILLFFLPVYIIYPNPSMLLFLQTLFIGLGAIPIYLLAKEKLHSGFGGLIFSISYLLYPALQNANLFEIHPVIFAIPFLLWGFYYIEKNNPKKSIIFIILALSCKETVSITVILLGIYTLFIKKSKFGLGITLLGVSWAFLTMGVILPHAYGTPFFAFLSSNHWTHLGDTSFEIVRNIITNPIYAITYTPLSDKIEYLIQLFLPLGFLSIISPSTLLIVFHEFTLKLTSKDPSLYSIHLHYTAVIIPFIFISAMNGIKRLCSILKPYKILNIILLIVLFMSLFSNTLFARFYPITNSIQILNRTIAYITYEVSDHNDLLFNTMDIIPRNSSVITQSLLCPHTSHVDRIYMLNDYIDKRNTLYKNETIDYIILDKTKPFNLPIEEVDNFIKNVSTEFVKVKSVEGIVLYKHK